MTPTKLLIGQIIVVFAIVVAGVWFATQWVAAQLAYQPELGPPWFMAFGRPVYVPWSLFGWWFSFEAYAPIQFEKAGAIAATSGLLGWPQSEQDSSAGYGRIKFLGAANPLHRIRTTSSR